VSAQDSTKSISGSRFRDIVRKKSTFDRFIDKFFKSDDEKQVQDSTPNEQAETETAFDEPNSNAEDNSVSTTPSSSDWVEIKAGNNIANDFTLVENEWESCESRNIAYSAVIFDEFVKELAAICQEHGLLIQN